MWLDVIAAEIAADKSPNLSSADSISACQYKAFIWAAVRQSFQQINAQH